MIKILNQSRQYIAILENAYGVSYEKRLNEIASASFTLPINDLKNAECQPLNFVEIIDELTGEYIGLFRIVPALTKKDESVNEIKYECDHVISTLLDSVLFKYNQTTGLTTRETIEFLLDKQTVKHWRLGQCDFTRYFSYSWENENGLLGALFSVPEPFDVPFEWTYDTRTYPWTLNLVAPSSAVTCEIRYGKNERAIERTVDPTNIVNRIYALGFGEGVNQLTIESVNGGVPYLEDATSIAKYGLCSYVWVDRRFEKADSLKANAQALLNQWKSPKVSYRVTAVDLSVLTGVDIDKLRVGRIVQIVDPDLGKIEARIIAESKDDIVGAPGDITLEIGNKTEDIGTTQSDLERRQQINELYSQGATNIDSHDFADNADPSNPAVIRFYLPEDLVNINSLDLTFECTNFRAYSKAAISTSTSTKTTTSGGGSTVTSNSGGGTTVTSSSGGGTTVSSSAGGATTATSSSYIEAHLVSGVPENSVGSTNYGNHLHTTVVPGHDHSVTIGDHVHSISIGSHTHSVSVGNHVHTVDISPHSHSLDIPGHGHDLEYGIYRDSILPTQTIVKVDGVTVPFTATNGENINLIPYIAKEANGSVKRGEWHTVEITPNKLARINAQVVSRLFIQSRTGGNY
jgi:phage minor structural protein